MACRGWKSDKTGEDTEKTDLRCTIHVPAHADLVLWLLGLVCWLISGIVHIVALYKGKSRKARKWWNVVTKILLVLVTLIVLLHSLAGVLFLSIDVSDIPL